MELAIIVLLVIIAVIAVSCIHIVPQAKAYVVERLGAIRNMGCGTSCQGAVY